MILLPSLNNPHHPFRQEIKEDVVRRSMDGGGCVSETTGKNKLCVCISHLHTQTHTHTRTHTHTHTHAHTHIHTHTHTHAHTHTHTHTHAHTHTRTHTLYSITRGWVLIAYLPQMGTQRVINIPQDECKKVPRREGDGEE